MNRRLAILWRIWEILEELNEEELGRELLRLHTRHKNINRRLAILWRIWDILEEMTEEELGQELLRLRRKRGR